MKDNQNYKLLTDKIFSGIVAIRANYDRMCQDNEKYPKGILVNFDNIIALLKKIERSGTMPSTIGFFGGQSRGKSSLINTLVGEDILPVSLKCGMTSVVIKLKHDPNVSKYKLEIISNNKENLTDRDNEFDFQNIKQQLVYYGSHKGNDNLEIETITVIHNFDKSTILKDGGILVDTPGAECAFDRVITEEDVNTNTPDTNVGDVQILDEQNHTDVLKALAILEDTQIVLFTERADNIGNKNSKVFFENNVKKLRPYTVINFKDRLKKDEKEDNGADEAKIESNKQERAKWKISEQYGVNINRAICVSCKEAIKEREKSNIPQLEKIILTELQNLQPEEGLVVCIQELCDILSRMSAYYKLVDKKKGTYDRKVPKDWVADYPDPKDVFSAGKSSFKFILELMEKENGYQDKKLLDMLQNLYNDYAKN